MGTRNRHRLAKSPSPPTSARCASVACYHKGALYTPWLSSRASSLPPMTTRLGISIRGLRPEIKGESHSASRPIRQGQKEGSKAGSRSVEIIPRISSKIAEHEKRPAHTRLPAQRSSHPSAGSVYPCFTFDEGCRGFHESLPKSPTTCHSFSPDDPTDPELLGRRGWRNSEQRPYKRSATHTRGTCLNSTGVGVQEIPRYIYVIEQQRGGRETDAVKYTPVRRDEREGGRVQMCRSTPSHRALEAQFVLRQNCKW